MEEINNIVNNSFLLSYIGRFLSFLGSKYRESNFHKICKNISRKFMLLLSESKFWSLFYEKSKLDSLYRESKTVALFNFIYNLPIILLAKVHDKFKDFFDASLIFKFLDFLGSKIIDIIGIILVINIVIPAHRWYNIYSIVLVLALTLIYIYKALKNDSIRFRLEELDLSLLVFIIIIVLSGLLSMFIKESMASLVYYILTFTSLMIIVNSVETKEDLVKLVNYLLVGLFLASLYSVYEWKFVGLTIDSTQIDMSIDQGIVGRVSGTMGNPNVFGELLVLLMPLFLVFIISSKSIIKKSLYSLGFILSLVILMKTGSRSAWISFIGAMAIFVFFWNKKYIPLLGLLALFSIPFLPQGIKQRFLTVFNPKDTSIGYRKIILVPALKMLKEYWIVGVGLGVEAFNVVYRIYNPYFVEHTHRLFLQICLESGILALLALLWLGFRLIKKTVYIRNNTRDRDLAMVAIGALAGIGGLMVMGFADHVWFYKRILFLTWSSIALILASFKLLEKDNG